MSRYIDAENYKKDLIQLGFLPALVVGVLDKQPTADVEEVRHGEWIRKVHIINEYGDTESNFVCSCCDKKYKRGEYTPKRFIEAHKFCPNCGAKMDGRSEE